MWYVPLGGDAAELAALAQTLSGSDVTIVHDGREYILISDQFLPTDDANTVLQKGSQLVAVLNGAARLVLDSTQPIKVGGINRKRADGTGEIYVFPDPAVIRIRASASIVVVEADGTTTAPNPVEPLRKWMTIAGKSEAVARVLRLHGNEKLDWVNLYRIFEIICGDVGGSDVIAANTWASKAAMRRFKHTANSPGAIGDESRHGAEREQPPADPMTISEARAMIDSVIHAWLRSKPV